MLNRVTAPPIQPPMDVTSRFPTAQRNVQPSRTAPIEDTVQLSAAARNQSASEEKGETGLDLDDRG